jgi:trehalose/maltose hydrolase-like predicted phosphorylase
MFVPFHDDGIISQFEGYESSRSSTGTPTASATATSSGSTASSRPRATRPTATRLSKQADVLMLFYLFSADELREIFERLGYRSIRDDPAQRRLLPGAHLARLDAERVVHAWVLARSDRAALVEALRSRR